jgi:hypothetical protein
MANYNRGEINAELDGKQYKLCLTLGSLSELEQTFEHDSLLGLAARLTSGKLRAIDIIRIIGAGLRGGGNDISDDVVAIMRTVNGVAGFVEIATRLLIATFGDDSDHPTQKLGEPTAQPEKWEPVFGGSSASKNEPLAAGK